ncbi:uncharacterized protein LOC109407965 [Aedes albopictus]|uniref:C2h2-type zn-finger protein n=1 Tax=Aedes albopictus TaxID=7160 RepID=A0ABM1Z1I4_AEDAL
MAGYKCVNFGDLCRLCASSSGGRVGIFTDEGKRKNIHVKITDCLKIKIYEKDRLPKSVCAKCLKQLEAHVEFRESVVKAQSMLESCLNSTKLRNGGMVYIKDDSTKDDLPTTSPQASISSSPSTATITLPTIQTQPPAAQTTSPQVKLLPTIPASSSTLQQQQPTASITTAPAMTPIIINSLPKGFGQGTTGGTATIMAPNADFLTSIMQAVGIQTGETSVAAAAVAAAASTQDTSGQNQQQQQPLAQYTITVDGQTIKANQIHYKIQDGTTGGQGSVLAIDGEQQQQQGSSYQAQMDEFLKLKTPVKSASRKELEKTSEPVSAKKPKISVLIKPPQTPQTTLVTSTPPKQTILAATTPMATAISSSPITLTPVSSTTSIASFSAAPTGTIFTSTPLAANSATVKSTAAIPVLDAAKMMQGNKCIVPIMLKAEGGGEQIALAPIANVGEMNKSMVSNVQYVQMKLQPGPDGMFRLAPAQMPPALTLTPQGLQQFGISPIQTVQTQPAQQQIQIQPQQIQAQLTMPSVQVPLSNYLSLVEKSTQLQNQTSEVQQPQQANIVITTQPVQQQSQQQQQQQTPVQQTQHLQVVQRPTIQVQQPAQQTPPKPPKPNPPQPSQPSPITHRRESSSQDHHSQLNSSSESLTSATNASLAATQQMKAISALSLLKQDTHHDSMVGGSTSQGNTASSVSSTVSFTSCDVCSKSFKRKEHLMQHLKSHVGLRPFKCDETGCSKSFSRKEHLMRHIVSHTGKKLFACPICRKYFSRKDNLNKHKKTHQQNSSSAPYHCTICSKHFYIKGHFLKHKQMHDMAKDAQQSEKKSPVKPKVESSERSQQLPTVQQQQQSQQQQQQQPQHQIQQVQLPTQQQVQPQPQIQPATVQSQQIFTIPAAQLQSALSGKGPILQQLQIAMPTSMATATSHHSTLQTVSASTLAGLGVGGATVTASSANSGGTRTAIIKSADGSSATVYTLPSNFIIDGTQFLSAMQQQQQSRELMGSIGNIKIEQIT